ncbi:MAG: rod shape-determining protein RodA [Rikenellaceae bacterium]|nr:rod shape-determining protein RodA [Rikenellaceae bacterium]
MLRNSSYGGSRSLLTSSVDWVMILLYVGLVLIGWLSICSASYDETAIDPYAFSHFYVKQVLWVAMAFVVALVVMLLDDKYYHMLAYPAYIGGLLILIGTLLFGKEVNGAKAWIEFGFFSLQPVELVKIATALAMARVMSSYSFSINRFSDLLRVATIIALPLLIIILQNDTGSGIVLCSFIFVLYREGLNKWLCIPFLLIAALFIGSFVFTPMTMLVLLILICTVSEVLMNGRWQSRLIYLAVLALVSVTVYLVSNYLIGWTLSAYKALLGTTALSLVGVVIYAYRAHLRNIFIVVAMFVGSMIFLPTTDYLFNSVLKEHQQNRIYSFLGIINDPKGIDFNVNQSKIAIGSGGLFGKGFLEGTQVKYNFVPENHTDFIFCTVGEEWGFVGCLVVLAMYCTLILRLMRIGERQEEPFGRIYCYCVASILLFHLMVNVGMTIGLMPVMGIPLPFMSYGGSSLLAFTLLLFIAIRFDASRRRFGVE